MTPAAGPSIPSPGARRGRGRPKVMADDEQAAKILAAARALFLANGYGGTTMDDVARRCRCSKRTLYRLFPSKPALFGDIIDAHRQTMVALPGDYDDLPLAEAITRIFLVDVDDDTDRSRIALMRFIMLEAQRYPEVAAVAAERGRERTRALITDWLERQRTLGRAVVPDVACATRMLMDVFFAALVLMGPDAPEWPGMPDRRTYLRRAITLFVEGIRPRVTAAGDGPG